MQITVACGIASAFVVVSDGAHAAADGAAAPPARVASLLVAAPALAAPALATPALATPALATPVLAASGAPVAVTPVAMAPVAVAPAAAAAPDTPCVLALPRLTSLGRATITSRCGRRGAGIHDGDRLELSPRAHVRMQAPVEGDGGRPLQLEVTCLSSSAPVAVTVQGNEPPWLGDGALTCSEWKNNERSCVTAAGGDEVLVCTAQTSERDSAPLAEAERPALGMPTWYVRDAPEPPEPPKAVFAARARGDVRVAVVVADLRDGGVGPVVSSALSDLVSFELSRMNGIDVVAYADIRATIDNSANAQLAGCETEACVVDASKLFDVPYLLHGSVAPSSTLAQSSVADGDGAVVNIALVDTVGARVIGRAREQVRGDESAMVAAVRVLAANVIAPLAGGDEIDSTGLGDVLQRLRTQQRPKPWDVGASVAVVVPFTVASLPVLVTPGVAGAAEGTYALLPWLSVGGRASLTWAFGSLPGSLVAAGQGGVIRSATTAEAQWLNVAGEAIVRVRPSEGLVLPFVEAGVGGGYASLQLGDEIAERDDVSEFLQRQREAGSGPSLNGFLSAGIDALLTDQLALRLALDASAAATGLRQREFIGDAPKNDATQLADEPVPPLVFVGIRLGVSWQG